MSGTIEFTVPLYLKSQTLKIVHFERLNIVITLRLWAKFWEHSQVQIHCDNVAVVQVVSSSKTKDKFLAACIRNIWFCWFPPFLILTLLYTYKARIMWLQIAFQGFDPMTQCSWVILGRIMCGTTLTLKISHLI